MWELTLVTECNNKRIMDVVLPLSEGVALWTIVDLILAQGNLLQTGSQSFRLALPTELLLLKRLSTVFAGVSNECLYGTVILMLPIKIPLFLTF